MVGSRGHLGWSSALVGDSRAGLAGGLERRAWILAGRITASVAAAGGRRTGKSDFVVIVAPHTPDTYKLFRRDCIRRMKPSPYLINVGRGVVVDLTDLTAALKAGEIAGAGLDVFEVKPLPPEHRAVGSDNPGSYGVAIQTDGRIVVAGSAQIGSYHQFVVLRYLASAPQVGSFTANCLSPVLAPVGPGTRARRPADSIWQPGQGNWGSRVIFLRKRL